MVQAAVLPGLRPELQLFPGPPDAAGAPTWTIHDPVRDRYYRLGWSEREILARWGIGVAPAVVAAVNAETTLRIHARQVDALARFLAANGLTRRHGPDGVRQLQDEERAAHRSVAAWLLHNYLFVRLPLVSPDAFLERTAPLARRLFGRSFLILLLLCFVTDMVLLSQRWDSMVTAYPHFFSLAGGAMFVGALALAKLVHELAHAYTAKLAGCRIPTMGVALMVLWPVLYTDTSAAWRLTRRRDRLAIGAAGVAAELALAIIATLAWALLPDGLWRSGAMILATVTWVTTLSVNLNPLMRFDGYYLLSDLLDVPNLQARAFTMARERMRRFLWGLEAMTTDVVASSTRIAMMAYAYATWLYRLVLFTGIALLVYHMAFKLLGLLLFAVEIGWFVLLPVVREMRLWWSMRRKARGRRVVVTLASITLVTILAALPVQQVISFPAVLAAERHTRLYPPAPAQVERMRVAEGQEVTLGEVVMELSAPDLENALSQTRQRMEGVEWQIAHLTNLPDIRDRILVLEEELAAAKAEMAGHLAQRERLQVRAPFAGQVTRVAEGMVPGQWVSTTTAMVDIVAFTPLVAEGYVSEADVEHLSEGARGRFIPDGSLGESLEVRVRQVDGMPAVTIAHPHLASVNQGTIATRKDERGRLIPTEAAFLVRLAVEAGRGEQQRRGTVVVSAPARSLLGKAWLWGGALFVREMGF